MSTASAYLARKLMAVGALTVPVVVAGVTRRGALSVAERVVDTAVGQVLERSEVLTMRAADVVGVARHTTITVDGASRVVRDRIPLLEGDLVELILAGG